MHRLFLMKASRSRSRSRAGSILKLIVGSILLLIGGALVFLSVCLNAGDWREFDPQLIESCPAALQIFDRTGELISVSGPEKRIPVKLSELKECTVNAFITTEDTRFYRHGGIDLYRIAGAAWADIKAGGFVQGASTISQQLIKLSHLSPEKTLDRKFEEALLALQLESRYSKDEIMEMYLNYIYFGSGFYGIEAASLGYFGIHASQLSVSQSALLAGILKSPSAYAPHIDLEASKARRDTILKKMAENGLIDTQELDSSLNEKVELKNALTSQTNAMTELAVREAAEMLCISREDLQKSGYRIFTSMDCSLNDYCAELFGDDANFPSENAQGALIVLDGYGRIAAMVPGRGGHSPGGMNRAIDSKRQPGSLIKPVFVYAPAIEMYGYEPNTELLDAPRSFGDYEPRNSDEKYYGYVTLRTAVAKSLNIPAVTVLSDIGLPSAIMFSESLGLDLHNETPCLPMALGGFRHGVSVYEMAGAYSAFQRGGVYVKPSCVDRIVDRNGNTLYVRASSGKRVMRETTANAMTSMLINAAAEGTAKRLYDESIELAAKTGTSVDANGVRDAWCAAYSPEYTAVIWMGTDSSAEGSLPSEAVGGNHPALILKKLFQRIYESRSCPSFGCSEANETSGKEVGVDLTAPDALSENVLMPENVGWSISAEGKPVISFESRSDRCGYVIVRIDKEGNKERFEIDGRIGYIGFTDENADPDEEYDYCLYEKNGDRVLYPAVKEMRIRAH